MIDTKSRDGHWNWAFNEEQEFVQWTRTVGGAEYSKAPGLETPRLMLVVPRTHQQLKPLGNHWGTIEIGEL